MANESNAAAGFNAWKLPSFDSAEGAEAGPPTTLRPAGTPPGPGFAPTVSLFPRAAGAAGEGFAPEGPAPGEAGSGEPDFAAIKFQRENTLLTNAEKYAESIREEAELYVARMRREVDVLNREAEQRYEEARQVKETAQRDAERLVADAQEQVEEIREQARREGLEEGKAEGMRQRYQEAGPNLERLEKILEEVSQFRRQVAYYAEKDSVRLAVLMAKKVLMQELTINRKAVWNLLAKTLATLRGQGSFRIWLNPGDHEFAQAARPSLERFLDGDQVLTFRARPDLPPGNVQIETDREVIDLTFQTQFHYLEALLNQALAERESVVTNRPPPAAPSLGDPARNAPPPPAPPSGTIILEEAGDERAD